MGVPTAASVFVQYQVCKRVGVARPPPPGRPAGRPHWPPPDGRRCERSRPPRTHPAERPPQPCAVCRAAVRPCHHPPAAGRGLAARGGRGGGPVVAPVPRPRRAAAAHQKAAAGAVRGEASTRRRRSPLVQHPPQPAAIRGRDARRSSPAPLPPSCRRVDATSVACRRGAPHTAPGGHLDRPPPAPGRRRRARSPPPWPRTRRPLSAVAGRCRGGQPRAASRRGPRRTHGVSGQAACVGGRATPPPAWRHGARPPAAADARQRGGPQRCGEYHLN